MLSKTLNPQILAKEKGITRCCNFRSTSYLIFNIMLVLFPFKPFLDITFTVQQKV